jgi:transposase InsO family protein
MNAFVDQYRDTHGVEPICKVLQIAPSAYRRHAARQRDPELRSGRAKRDEALLAQVKRVWQSNLQVYGAQKVWRQLRREGHSVARCTVERLMSRSGLRGVVRGKVVRTTISEPPRVSRRLHFLRRWSHEQIEEVLGSTTPAAGSRPRHKRRPGRRWSCSIATTPTAGWTGSPIRRGGR